MADNLADNRKAGTDGGGFRHCRGRNGGAWHLLRRCRISMVVYSFTLRLSEHITLLLFCLAWKLWKLVSDGTEDTVKAGAKMAEHFAPSRLGCCCEFIDTDLRTNKRNHLAAARSCGIWKISYIDR